jgi:hypothetical protein
MPNLKHPTEVKFELPTAPIVHDLHDTHGRLWNWRCHAIEKPEIERRLTYPREAAKPVTRPLPVLNVLARRHRKDCGEELALDVHH